MLGVNKSENIETVGINVTNATADVYTPTATTLFDRPIRANGY
jgi:hypothetical protein